MADKIKIGKFTIERLEDDKFWVETEFGEGGSFSEEDLEELLDLFYDENF